MDRPAPPPCCLWVMRLSCHHCRWLDPGCTGRPLSAPDPGEPLVPYCPVWPLTVLFGPVPGDPGRPCVLGPLESPCPLGSPVEGLASLPWM